jgi:uncharacterized protein HemX
VNAAPKLLGVGLAEAPPQAQTDQPPSPANLPPPPPNPDAIVTTGGVPTWIKVLLGLVAAAGIGYFAWHMWQRHESGRGLFARETRRRSAGKKKRASRRRK